MMTSTLATTDHYTRALRSYLVISDIHLGARSTSAREILDHLTAFFDDFTAKSQFTSIDVLFIAGDLWDDTVDLSSEATVLFLPWIRRLFAWCCRHDIKVRILKGTPRHDREQGDSVEALAGYFENLDFKYISTLAVERIEDLDLNVLYVPDEVRPTAEAVARDVEEILMDRGLPQVDIAIMHGMFKHQLGTIPMNVKVHDEAWYLERVKYYINIGHVHVSSQFSRILTQGSFDRLNHGEERPKGAFLVKELKPGEWGHFFIENPLAKIYKTVEVSEDVELALQKIDREIRSLPHGSFIRILANSTHPIFKGFETLRRKYPLFTFSKKAISEEEEVAARQQTEPSTYVSMVLNRSTLTEAVFSEVTVQHTLTVAEETQLYAHLEALHE